MVGFLLLAARVIGGRSGSGTRAKSPVPLFHCTDIPPISWLEYLDNVDNVCKLMRLGWFRAPREQLKRALGEPPAGLIR